MKRVKLNFDTQKVIKNATKSLFSEFKPPVKKVGSLPGTLVYTGQKTAPTTVKLFQYDRKGISFKPVNNIDELKKNVSKTHVNWVDLTGFQNIEFIGEIGTYFEIDPLTLEDMLNVNQLPKIEEHDDYLYITLKLVELIPNSNTFEFTHYSMVIKGNTLLTFSENPNKLFDNIEELLQHNFNQLKHARQNYLSYRIIDTIVDHYNYSLDLFAVVLSDLELELIQSPTKMHIQTILRYKKQWLILRKALYPFKDAIRKMLTVEAKFIKKTGRHFITDLSDHLQSIAETMEILNATLNNLMDLYNSTVSNKMNEVMKVLTIVSTIFIPLTFIAGVYGMNFKSMPELQWENGYYYSLLVMVAISVLMIIFMKRKRWL